MIHPIKSIVARQQHWSAKHFVKTKYGKQIALLKDTHVGESCFVIGNGPSLSPEDLEKIHKLGIDTFAANRVYKIFNKTNWRPIFFLCEDPVIICEIEKEINQLDCHFKLIPVDLKWYKSININNALYFNMDYRRDDSVNMGFIDELSDRVTCNGTVTITAIQFAIYMGYKNIYLLGVDHNYAQIIDSNGNVIIDNTVKNYFDDSYEDGFSGNVARNLDDTTKGFLRMRDYSLKEDVKIINCTRGGKLEVFERAAFDSVIENWR